MSMRSSPSGVYSPTPLATAADDAGECEEEEEAQNLKEEAAESLGGLTHSVRVPRLRNAPKRLDL